MEVQQCMKLTGTNHSSGLIALAIHARSLRRRGKTSFDVSLAALGRRRRVASAALRRLGGHCEVIKPDPIPNSAVKLLSADGTKSQDLGE